VWQINQGAENLRFEGTKVKRRTIPEHRNSSSENQIAAIPEHWSDAVGITSASNGTITAAGRSSLRARRVAAA
jgi:hypothetical protein